MLANERDGDEYVCLACGWVGYPSPVPTLDEIEEDDIHG